LGRPITGVDTSLESDVHQPAPVTSACWEWRATGTIWKIHHSGYVSGAAAQRTARMVAHYETLWSRFRRGSELSRVNARAGEAVSVCSETMALLAACEEWVRRTEGVFQPLVGRAITEWGYDTDMGRAPSGTEYSPCALPITEAVELDLRRRTVYVPAGGLIDLGGIAKGWIADRCREPLLESTADESVLLDAGGELLAVRGTHTVAVIHNGALCGSVTVHEGEAVATSGFSVHRWVNGDGALAHHLIDPVTGRPGARAHATVVAETAAAADVRSTYLALRPDTVDAARAPALVTLPGGDRQASQGWAEASAREAA
jgi:thiamine biosynthesis lipoprotein ApbE